MLIECAKRIQKPCSKFKIYFNHKYNCLLILEVFKWAEIFKLK